MTPGQLIDAVLELAKARGFMVESVQFGPQAMGLTAQDGNVPAAYANMLMLTAEIAAGKFTPAYVADELERRLERHQQRMQAMRQMGVISI